MINKLTRSSALGKSLEIHLGLKNNNIPKADWGNYELKSISNPGSKISLFLVRVGILFPVIIIKIWLSNMAKDIFQNIYRQIHYVWTGQFCFQIIILTI